MAAIWKAVEDVQRLGAFLANHVQVGPPHIRADELDLRRQLLSDDDEEALEALEGAFLADSEQAGKALVDLVDQGQVFMSFGVLDFIQTNGANRLHALSQEVWNASAVSFQESFRAQRARNSL